jgi:hypothetical protein
MNALELHGVAAFGSPEYLVLLMVVLFGRGMDMLSTWIATPTLELEANPLARWLGWRAGVVVNLVVSSCVALLPLAAISIATTSVMVASRNLQSAWLTRVLGEHQYRQWISERYREGRRGVFFICLVLHSALVGIVGGALMVFSRLQLVPFAVGFGILTYACAIAVFTGFAMHRAAQAEMYRQTTIARQIEAADGPAPS